MKTDVVPQNFEDWQHCIVVKCGLELSPAYIAERISALTNASDHHTQQFTRLYGEQHLQNVISWFRQAEKNV